MRLEQPIARTRPDPARLSWWIIALIGLLPAPAFAEEARAVATAELYGRTLGEASQCKEVAALRLEAAATRAAAHIKTIAGTGAATRGAAGARFDAAMQAGAAAIHDGAVTCAQAAAELDNLEHELPP
jgi:hypothetical protein